MKRSSIQKLLELHRTIGQYEEDFKAKIAKQQALIEEVLLAECSKEELESNTSVNYGTN